MSGNFLLRVSLFSASLALVGCASGALLIDARRDARAPVGDGGVVPLRDGGMQDAGMDGGSGDAGEPPCLPPTPTPWDPIDTEGPPGETLADCITRSGTLTDPRIPEGQGYDLTTFGGPGDEQPVACAGRPDADGTWYYAANGQRFTCGRHLRVVNAARTECVIVEVADVGPNACVEEAGGQPILDVSPLAAQALFMVSSVGYSEHRAVFAASVDNGNPLGPCNHVDDPADILDGFIGGPCNSVADCTYTSSQCLTAAQGYPGGLCSQSCTSTCPDRVGANAFTACAELDDGQLHCLARCDYSLFESGCRDGYGCELRPPPGGLGASRYVCLPLDCL